MVLYRFFVSSWFSLGRLYVSRNLSISCTLSKFWLIIVVSSYNCMYFHDISCTFFISSFIYLGHLLFLWVWLRVYQFYIDFLKTQLLVSLIFSFFSSTSFISTLIFIISFLLLTLDFVFSSFSSSFECHVRLLIWDFPYFLR